jgi:hypothetical protein
MALGLYRHSLGNTEQNQEKPQVNRAEIPTEDVQKTMEEFESQHHDIWLVFFLLRGVG